MTVPLTRRHLISSSRHRCVFSAASLSFPGRLNEITHVLSELPCALPGSDVVGAHDFIRTHWFSEVDRLREWGAVCPATWLVTHVTHTEWCGEEGVGVVGGTELVSKHGFHSWGVLLSSYWLPGFLRP